jgi:hypothetical protein
MSGDAKRVRKADAPSAEAEQAEAKDALEPGGDVSDEDVEKLAEEAEHWLDAEGRAQDAGKSAVEEAEEPPLSEVEVRDLLRSALRPPPGSVAPSLLGGVQKKLRTRSKGKFYGDGWSTARSPRSTYLVTSVLMLVLLGFVFLVLVPWSGGALP